MNQKEKELLEYCKNKTIPKDWVHIMDILKLREAPRVIQQRYACFILAASGASLESKIKRFHRQISFGCSLNDEIYTNLNKWIRSLKEEDWESTLADRMRKELS